MLVFFHEHSRITGLQAKGESISLTPHYHFHRLHRHFDISRAITAESSSLHIASSRSRTENWFPSASLWLRVLQNYSIMKIILPYVVYRASHDFQNSNYYKLRDVTTLVNFLNIYHVVFRH